jgi:hypothetical protein
MAGAMCFTQRPVAVPLTPAGCGTEITKREEDSMLIRNNDGEVTGEMNVSITQDGTVIRTNTMYQNGRPVTQNISIRDTQGGVRTTNVIGGKILP